MYYRAFTDNPIERYQATYFDDDRSPGELGAGLVAEGYLLVLRGDVAWSKGIIDNLPVHSFSFTPRGQTVLLREHVIRIDVVDEDNPSG